MAKYQENEFTKWKATQHGRAATPEYWLKTVHGQSDEDAAKNGADLRKSWGLKPQGHSAKKGGGKKKGAKKASRKTAAAKPAEAAKPAQTAPAKRRKRATVATPTEPGAVNLLSGGRTPMPPMSNDDRQHIVDLHKLTPEERRNVIASVRATVRRREIEERIARDRAELEALWDVPSLVPGTLPGTKPQEPVQKPQEAPQTGADAPGPDAGEGEPDRSNDELLPATQRRRKRTG